MNEKKTDTKSAATRAVYDCALAVIDEKERCGIAPLTATTAEVADRLRIGIHEAAFEFGRIDAFGVAECGRTLNGHYLKRKDN